MTFFFSLLEKVSLLFFLVSLKTLLEFELHQVYLNFLIN